MAKEVKMGSNRTGIAMSPVDSKELIKAAQQSTPTSEGDGRTALAAMRADYIAEGESVGSMPPPATLKGALKSGMDMMTGDRPHVLLDKLGERLAFERGGTRLYDALLVKYDAHPNAPIAVDRGLLEQFRNEEAAHFELLCEAIEELGGDPTAQTPCADVTGVQAMGLVQAINDPRTSMAQSIGTVLIAELADEAGWEMLIGLAQSSGHDHLAQRFQTALAEESVHRAQARSWLEELTLAESSVMPA